MSRVQQLTRSRMTLGALMLMLLVGFSGTAFAGEDAVKLVNVNTATAKQLRTLPGIGKIIAGRIISHRTSHGPFKNVREMVKVWGIGKRTIEKLEDRVTTAIPMDGDMGRDTATE